MARARSGSGRIGLGDATDTRTEARGLAQDGVDQGLAWIIAFAVLAVVGSFTEGMIS
ncbi:MAG: hypothetical protein H8E78_09850 [Proteobacteria bacterium]|nr:hypothetical protein [Pseudomonadota bacterium]